MGGKLVECMYWDETRQCWRIDFVDPAELQREYQRDRDAYKDEMSLGGLPYDRNEQ